MYDNGQLELLVINFSQEYYEIQQLMISAQAQYTSLLHRRTIIIKENSNLNTVRSKNSISSYPY